MEKDIFWGKIKEDEINSEEYWKYLYNISEKHDEELEMELEITASL